MYTIYVLKSLKNSKRYIGFTSQEITKRLNWHRWGLTAWTRQNGPFELIYFEKYNDKAHALRRERYFKTGNGRKTLELFLGKKLASSRNTDGPATLYGRQLPPQSVADQPPIHRLVRRRGNVGPATYYGGGSAPVPPRVLSCR